MRCHSQLSNFQIPIEVSALPPTSPDGAWMQPLMWRKDVLTISQINVYGPFSVGDRRWNKQRSCLRLQTRTQQLVSPSSWWFPLSDLPFNTYHSFNHKKRAIRHAQKTNSLPSDWKYKMSVSDQARSASDIHNRIMSDKWSETSKTCVNDYCW